MLNINKDNNVDKAEGMGQNENFEDSSEEKTAKAKDLDDVLTNEIGQFGLFQLRNMVLVAVPIIISAFTGEFVFSAAAIPHRCRIPECGEYQKLHEIEPDWLAGAIPRTGNEFASCNRFAPRNLGFNGSLDYCPENLFDTSVTVRCDSFIYARDNSVVYDFNLGCQEWLRALAGTLNSVGTLLALSFTGYISDRYGRKVALIISVFNHSLFGLIRSFSVNYSMYLAFQILQTTLGAGIFSSAYIFATELVGPKYRVVVSAIIMSMYAIGQVILGGVAWLVQPWRHMIIVLHIPCFLIMCYYWIISESVRWLLSKKKYVESRMVLEKVAKVNNKVISEKSMEMLLNPPQLESKPQLVGPKYRVVVSAIIMSMYAIGQVILGGVAWLVQPWRHMIIVLHIPCFLIMCYYWIISESVRWLLSKKKYVESRMVLEKVAKVNNKVISEKSMEMLLNPPQLESKPQTENNNLFRSITKSPVLLKRIYTTPIWWITSTFVYYGLSINSTGLSDTMYLNYILTAAVEIPGYFTAVLILDRIGRKLTLCIGYFFSAACNIAFVFIPSGLTTVRLVVFLLGKFSISIVMKSMYLYTAELYPTEYRHSFLSFSSMVGRIGSITAPLTPALMVYWHGIPPVLFGIMGTLSGILVLTQPETLGTKMPNTLAEAEALGKPESKVQS